jgi:lyso-ornithine lipid O-acyltransferase
MSKIKAGVRLATGLALTAVLSPLQMFVAAPLLRNYTTIPHLYFGGLSKIMGLKVDLKGEEIIKDRPVVFAAGPHLGDFDEVILGGKIKGSFVAKWSIQDIPFIGPAAKAAQTVFIQRTKEFLPLAWDMAAKVVKAGRNLIVFPEATTGDGVTVRQFKAGLMRFMFNEEARPDVEKSLPANLVVQPLAMRVTEVSGVTVEQDPSLRSFFAQSADNVPYFKSPGDLLRNAWNVLLADSVTIEVTALKPLNPRDFANAQDMMNTARRMVTDIVAPGQPEPPPHKISLDSVELNPKAPPPKPA